MPRMLYPLVSSRSTYSINTSSSISMCLRVKFHAPCPPVCSQVLPLLPSVEHPCQIRVHPPLRSFFVLMSAKICAEAGQIFRRGDASRFNRLTLQPLWLRPPAALGLSWWPRAYCSIQHKYSFSLASAGETSTLSPSARE
jgi:hypothetical protein